MSESPESNETLLQKAKRISMQKKLKPIGNEEIELAIAWMKNEITFTQIAAVTKNTNYTYAYSLISRALKEAYDKGLLVVKGNQ